VFRVACTQYETRNRKPNVASPFWKAEGERRKVEGREKLLPSSFTSDFPLPTSSGGTGGGIRASRGLRSKPLREANTFQTRFNFVYRVEYGFLSD
jgi:hypothetical protein